MWKNFKEKSPYNWQKEIDGGHEIDWDVCYFIYRFTDRPPTMNHGPFIAGPVAFKEGCFVGYEGQMLKSFPYPTDWIEVLAWCYKEDAHSLLLNSGIDLV